MESLNYKAGYIYSNVIEKRLDDSSFTMNQDLQKAYIENSKLYFDSKDGFRQSLKEGMFMLRIPGFIDIAECDLFAQNFYKGPSSQQYNFENYREAYAKFREYTCQLFDDSLLGFHERVDQIEQFLLEKRFWDEWYPNPIKEVAYQLCSISTLIVRTILQAIDIAPRDYDIATGGCASSKGSYHLTFNHYRPSILTKGLSSHKDDGFTTILRTVSPGLEVNRYDKWERVNVDKDYFIINFGLAMEILTKKSSCPVSAIMHRVSQQKNDRWSWGHFSSSQCVSEYDQGIYEFTIENGLRRICDSRQLINNNDHEIYFGTKNSGTM